MNLVSSLAGLVLDLSIILPNPNPVRRPYFIMGDVEMAETASEGGRDIPSDIQGYRKLAEYMGENPNFAIFRRFGQLNALNLLYLQAELAEMEQLLSAQAAADRASSSACAQDRALWFKALSFEEKPHVGHCEQWRLMLRIREVLKEYSTFHESSQEFAPNWLSDTALVRQNQVCRLPKPHKYDLNHLCEWKRRPVMGHVRLIGPDKDIWETQPWPELVALDAERFPEPLTGWLQRNARHFHRYVGRYFVVSSILRAI
jgi:hypothetical protein